MDDAFIGRYAVSLRVSRLEEELTQIEDQLRYWNPMLLPKECIQKCGQLKLFN